MLSPWVPDGKMATHSRADAACRISAPSHESELQVRALVVEGGPVLHLQNFVQELFSEGCESGLDHRSEADRAGRKAAAGVKRIITQP